MKKTLIIILLIMFILTGCVKKTGAENADNPNNTQSQDVTVLKRDKEQPAESENVETAKTNENIEADGNDNTDNNEVIEITEKMFLTQINDIYYNFEDYKGKIIKVQGMYDSGESYLDGNMLHMVYRNGPGCCGNDGWGGFYLNYDGEYPIINDWIEVTGTAQMVESDEYSLLYLNVSNLTVMEERGAEYVEQ